MIRLGYKFVTILSDFRVMSSHSQEIVNEMKNQRSDKSESNSYWLIFFFKKGTRNTIQAKKKNILPPIAQKFPILETIKQREEITKSIQPIKFNKLLFIF